MQRGKASATGVTLEGEGLCPRCGGVGRYRYTVRGSPRSSSVVVEYEFECAFCGHRERARIELPLKAAYYLRYLLDERARIEVERTWHASRLKAVLGECIGGCGE